MTLGELGALLGRRTLVCSTDGKRWYATIMKAEEESAVGDGPDLESAIEAAIVEYLATPSTQACDSCGALVDGSPAWRYVDGQMHHRCAGAHPQIGTSGRAVARGRS